MDLGKIRAQALTRAIQYDKIRAGRDDAFGMASPLRSNVEPK